MACIKLILCRQPDLSLGIVLSRPREARGQAKEARQDVRPEDNKAALRGSMALGGEILATPGASRDARDYRER